eukprot:NODE_211_length_12764_cov_0.923727.p3 type:complete len:323 gc:universal NODE_211_length_12764_cov_0.923727:1220-252(-)
MFILFHLLTANQIISYWDISLKSNNYLILLFNAISIKLNVELPSTQSLVTKCADEFTNHPSNMKFYFKYVLKNETQIFNIATLQEMQSHLIESKCALFYEPLNEIIQHYLNVYYYFNFNKLTNHCEIEIQSATQLIYSNVDQFVNYKAYQTCNNALYTIYKNEIAKKQYLLDLNEFMINWYYLKLNMQLEMIENELKWSRGRHNFQFIRKIVPLLQILKLDITILWIHLDPIILDAEFKLFYYFIVYGDVHYLVEMDAIYLNYGGFLDDLEIFKANLYKYSIIVGFIDELIHGMTDMGMTKAYRPLFDNIESRNAKKRKEIK